MDQASLFAPALERVGIVVNGPNPWDPQVHDQRFWNRLLAEGSLGLGEAYMDGWWDCADLAEFFNRILKGEIHKHLKLTANHVWQLLQARLLNMQNIARSRRVAAMHYNETDAYAASLDARMTGSCGYWPDGVTNVDQAQEAKLDMVCRKVAAQARRARLGHRLRLGRLHGLCRREVRRPLRRRHRLPRPGRLRPRALQGTSHRVPGQGLPRVRRQGRQDRLDGDVRARRLQELPRLLRAARRALKGDGLFMLHTIGQHFSETTIEPWLEKYIFPGGVIPSIAQVGKAIDGLWTLIDVHNIGPHYDKTLMAWNDNFEAKWTRRNTPEDVRFYRMWRYYLLCCAGGFRAKILQVWQFVLSTNGVPDGYVTAR